MLQDAAERWWQTCKRVPHPNLPDEELLSLETDSHKKESYLPSKMAKVQQTNRKLLQASLREFAQNTGIAVVAVLLGDYNTVAAPGLARVSATRSRANGTHHSTKTVVAALSRRRLLEAAAESRPI